MVRRFLAAALFLASLLGAGSHLRARAAISVSARLQLPPGDAARGHRPGFPPAVLWLKPLDGANVPAFPSHGPYILSQKDKRFEPHLLIVPVGAVVSFPNHDPFFHNVFSLFNGKRFDLGLYEAGKSRDVVFSREGVSYIFCNIHPEMSAVILSLSTPLFSIADAAGQFTLRNLAAGDYELHLWVEGQPASVLDHWVQKVHVSESEHTFGPFVLLPPAKGSQHENKFGQPYGPEIKSAY